MRIRSLAFAALLAAGAAAVALPACSVAQDKPIIVSADAWKGFQDYKAWLTSVGDGYFAISSDGTAWGSFGCPESSCASGSSVKSQAVKQCQTQSAGVPCVPFAHGRDILVPYTLAQ